MKHSKFQIIVSFLLITTAHAYSQATFVLGDRRVTKEELEAALPYINIDRVRLRDFPSIKYGKILHTLTKDTILSIHYVTEQKDLVNGELYPWYQVQVRRDPLQMGWVYGKYISFRNNYDEKFWNIWIFPMSHLNRRLFIIQFLLNYMHTDDYSVPKKWIEGKKPYKINKTGIWYLENNDWQHYKTDFGEVGILYNKERDSYPVFSIDISEPVSNLLINIGDPIDKLNAALGTDYSINNEILAYDFNGDLDSYYLRFIVKNKAIVRIEALQYYD